MLARLLYIEFEDDITHTHSDCMQINYSIVSMACTIDHAREAVLEYLLDTSDQVTSVLGQGRSDLTIAVGCWYLWWMRRKLVHDNHTQPSAQAVMSIRALLSNYAAATSPKAKVQRGGWSLPPPHYVKLNVDAGFDEMLRGTTGAVICDSRGNFIAAGNSRIEWCSDVLSAEVATLKYGLSLAQSIGELRQHECH